MIIIDASRCRSIYLYCITLCMSICMYVIYMYMYKQIKCNIMKMSRYSNIVSFNKIGLLSWVYCCSCLIVSCSDSVTSVTILAAMEKTVKHYIIVPLYAVVCMCICVCVCVFLYFGMCVSVSANKSQRNSFYCCCESYKFFTLCSVSILIHFNSIHFNIRLYVTLVTRSFRHLKINISAPFVFVSRQTHYISLSLSISLPL